MRLARANDRSVSAEIRTALPQHGRLCSGRGATGWRYLSEKILRSIVGGRSGAYEQEFAKAVHHAKDELRAAAEALNADAVIALDLDYEEVGDDMLMVAACGTAVKLG